jgi:hypothetical protein
MDTSGCMGAKCSTLKNQAITNAKACSVKPIVQEDHDGCKLEFALWSSPLVTTPGDTNKNFLIGITELPGLTMPMMMN